MDEMPSTEFRRRYASLTNPTRVTVNGHVIGVWTPGALFMHGTTEDLAKLMARPEDELAGEAYEIAARLQHGFNTRVPKKAR